MINYLLSVWTRPVPPCVRPCILFTCRKCAPLSLSLNLASTSRLHSLSLSFSQFLSLFLPPSATLTPFSISCANQQCPAAIAIADLTARTRKYNKYFCSLMAVFMKAITVFYRACNRTRSGGGIFNSY